MALIDIKDNDIEIYPKDTRSDPDATLRSALEFEKMGISLVIGPIFHKNLLFLDKVKSITFLSLTNRTLDLHKNIISSGINSSSQLNTIKKFLETSEIKKTIFLIPNLNYDLEIKKGIKESKIKFFRQYNYDIDPTKLRKVKEIEEKQDPTTGAKIIVKQEEYFLFQDKGHAAAGQGLKIHPDAIMYATSGMLDPARKRILSYLHKAIKPVNQLRMIEDAAVIYRIARAPERRMFKIDVGNLPKAKAEQYLRDVMARYRNKLVYDASTGEIRDDRNYMSMLEDFWLPVSYTHLTLPTNREV